MKTTLLLQISLRSLKKHKGRSFLTMLGIIIGISAIIATLAIGKGAEIKTKQKFLSMGDNYISISAGNWYQEGKTTARKRRRAPRLSFKDLKILRRLCPTIKNISPVTYSKEVINFRTNSLFVRLKGGNEDLLKILDRKLQRGYFFNKLQAKHSSRVVILGAKSAKELFNSLDPIGKTIQIKDVPYSVIGVLKRMENYHGVQDPNFDILMPVKTMKRYVYKWVTPYFSNIILSAPSREEIPKVALQIQKVMRFNRKIKEGEPNNFTVFDQASIMKAAKAASATIQLLLLIIASISLLVGGIGIMNIMLVSVTERTREIGIRMALGANSKAILRQFLVEALTLCLIGGIIGIALGVTVPHLIAHFTKWSPVVTTSSILISFLATSAIGIFFGFYPAYKASHLNPVDALAER